MRWKSSQVSPVVYVELSLNVVVIVVVAVDIPCISNGPLGPTRWAEYGEPG
jgi:hypothetical protein